MGATHIILDCLTFLCRKLSDLVEVRRSYNKNNFACFFIETRCIIKLLVTRDKKKACGPDDRYDLRPSAIIE